MQNPCISLRIILGALNLDLVPSTDTQILTRGAGPWPRAAAPCRPRDHGGPRPTRTYQEVTPSSVKEDQHARFPGPPQHSHRPVGRTVSLGLEATHLRSGVSGDKCTAPFLPEETGVHRSCCISSKTDKRRHSHRPLNLLSRENGKGTREGHPGRSQSPCPSGASPTGRPSPASRPHGEAHGGAGSAGAGEHPC